MKRTLIALILFLSAASLSVAMEKERAMEKQCEKTICSVTLMKAIKAIAAGNPDEVQTLLKQGLKANSSLFTMEFGPVSLLTLAIEMKNLPIIRALVEAGATVTADNIALAAAIAREDIREFLHSRIQAAVESEKESSEGKLTPAQA